MIHEIKGDIARIRNAIDRLNVRRYDVIYMLVLSLLGVLLEFASIGMLYPVFVLAENGGDISLTLKNQFVQILARVFALINVELTTPLLFVSVFLVAIIRQIVNYKRGLAARKVEYRNRKRLQKNAFRDVMASEIGLFHRFARGEIFSAIRAHSNRAAGIAPRLLNTAVNIVLLFLYFIGLFIIQPEIALLVLGLSVPVFLGFAHMTRLTKALGEQMTDLIDRLTKEIYAALDTVRLIKLRGMEEHIEANIAKDMEALRRNNVHADRLRMRMFAYTNPLIVAVILLAIYLSVNVMHIDLAKLGIIYIIMLRVVPLITGINSERYQIYLALHAVEKMYGTLDKAKAEHLRSGTTPYSGFRDSITFDNVSFQYEDPDTDTKRGGKIQNINFQIKKHNILGIVGPSGAGKSTMVDLLAGFYQPDFGQILIDNTPLQDLDIRSFRRHISYVTQERTLVHGTVRQNIEFGLPSPLSDEQIHRVLQLANCGDFVDELPEGWNTDMREGGKRLSVGQRQRLSIACALASSPDLLILDEPTSALDSEAEAAIQRTLEGLRGQVTIVIIAHRLSTIMLADTLVVVNKGEIVDSGTHDHLMMSSNAYRRLFASQMHL